MIPQISPWRKCSTSKRNWCANKKRSTIWTKFIDKNFHGNSCLWLVTKPLSSFNAQKSTSSQILCCALERSINIRNPTKLGRKRLSGSSPRKATDPMAASMGGDWIRVEHVPTFHYVPLCTRIHQLVRINFLRIRQPVRINFLCASISSFTCVYCLHLDEVHTACSNQRLMFISKPPQFLCKMCLCSVFTQTTRTQDRFRHVYHMKIVLFRLTTICQLDPSLSVFLERFSVCSPETSCIIRLFQFGFPEPLGTHVDRGSAVNHHQTFMGSWVPIPGCFFLGPIPWLFVLGSHSLAVFFYIIHFATTLAQVYNIDFVINRVNTHLVRLGIWVFDLDLVYHLVVVWSWPTVSCEMAPFSAHVAFFVVARLSFAFGFAVDLAFAFALIAILAFALAVAAAFCFFFCSCLCFCSCSCLSLCSCLFNPRPSELFLWSHSRSTSCSCFQRLRDHLLVNSQQFESNYNKLRAIIQAYLNTNKTWIVNGFRETVPMDVDSIGKSKEKGKSKSKSKGKSKSKR